MASYKRKESLRVRITRSYAHFLSSNPLIIIGFVGLLLFIASITSGWVENKTTDYRGTLPDDVDVIEANYIFADNFGGSESANIVLEIDPNSRSSNEPRDVRDLEVLQYADKLGKYVAKSTEIESLNSPIDILRSMNGGTIPKQEADVSRYMDKNPALTNYISSDYSMMLISLRLSDSYDENDLVYDIESSIDSIKAPPGITVSPSGSSIAGIYVNRELGSDMAKTSLLSMAGIVIVLIAIFGSIKYGLMPLTTIIIGIFLTFGYIGLVGIKMSSATNGVVSMIMGIGIDFGIQIINRFRQEKQKSKDIEKSMANTLGNVLVPMFTTTLAAVIGFQSMSMGQLTIMSEMGNIMTFGVIFCFFSAITFVPASVIIIERFLPTKGIKNPRRNRK